MNTPNLAEARRLAASLRTLDLDASASMMVDLAAEVERLRAQAAMLADPVAWQSRFVADGDKAWRQCSQEHHDMVQATPDEWQGYETRALVTAAAPAEFRN